MGGRGGLGGFCQAGQSVVDASLPISPFSDVLRDLEGEEGRSGEGDQDEEKTEEAQEGDRKHAKRRQDPGQPTAEEWRIHDITDLPYRSRCPPRVAGRGTGYRHLSQEVLGEDSLPTIGIDYHYMGSEGEEGTVPLLCVKDAHTKVLFDHVVTEGSEYVHGFASNR